MSVWSVLLRLLLSLSLVLNGATAVAAVHLPAAHGALQATATVAAAQAPVMSESMPCHGHQKAASLHAGQTGDEAAPSAPKPSAPDCCKSGTCRCPCVHATPAALPLMPVSALELDHDRSVRRLPLGHPAPALPHPIRPPIG